MYRIGEFARLAQVSVKALRHYDAIGLVRPAYTDARSGYRYYLAEQAAELNRVVALKGLGLSLDEIVELGRDADSTRARELLVARRREAERDVREAHRRVERIDASLARLERGDPSPFAIATKRVPARPVASIRASLASYDALSPLFDEVELYVGRHGARAMRGARYHGCAGAELDAEALGFLRRPIPSSERVRVYELPPGEVAAVVHAGPLESAPAAFAALEAWVRESEALVDGPFVELYYGGGSSGDPVVEIQFPIRH